MTRCGAWVLVAVWLLLVVLSPAPSGAQAPAEAADALHRPLDQLLDTYVRDGLVYYRALRAERGRLDRYVASLDVPAAVYDRWTREAQLAFWINAYNAFVLRTVIDHYPPPGGTIRRIPGAFTRLRRRAAGREVTLDAIEYEVLPAFRDPRVYFALGRGAVGSGRLRSEAYLPSRLEAQLAAQAREFLTRQAHVHVDALGNRIAVSPIFGWHEAEFAEAYAAQCPPAFAARTPIERAVLALVYPLLLPAERAFVDQNAFRLTYQEFDWSLNDLR
ncbi:MAG TPA: DUF547 domain-containing protein [Vicinamibacterales bacterium]|nr:DUF547 domain-containing protein [Vicinamibacterales bacterium]